MLRATFWPIQSAWPLGWSERFVFFVFLKPGICLLTPFCFLLVNRPIRTWISQLLCLLMIQRNGAGWLLVWKNLKSWAMSWFLLAWKIQWKNYLKIWIALDLQVCSFSLLPAPFLLSLPSTSSSVLLLRFFLPLYLFPLSQWVLCLISSALPLLLFLLLSLYLNFPRFAPLSLRLALEIDIGPFLFLRTFLSPSLASLLPSLLLSSFPSLPSPSLPSACAGTKFSLKKRWHCTEINYKMKGMI